jgi:hypothetical protein
MASNKTVSIAITEPAEEVGKALRITVAPTPPMTKDQWVYLPLSTVWEIHSDHIVCDQWIAVKKGLVQK